MVDQLRVLWRVAFNCQQAVKFTGILAKFLVAEGAETALLPPLPFLELRSLGGFAAFVIGEFLERFSPKGKEQVGVTIRQLDQSSPY
jgi:hypothetical protein